MIHLIYATVFILTQLDKETEYVYADIFFDSEDKMAARIVIISGACGTGKSSSSRLLAEKSPYDCAVHIHSDDFYQYIRKGYIAPWLEGSGKQNEVMIEAVAASAERFSAGGYEVFVDGTIGPWFLEPWEKLLRRELM